MNMIRAELHSHTWYSFGTKIRVEGLHSPEQMIRRASLLGLHALAITDHDTFRGAIEAERFGKKYGVTIIKGEEITTDEDKHVIGLGLSEFIPRGKPFWDVLDAIRAQGGIAIAPHPFDINNKGVGKLALACDAIEVFNAINKDRLSNRKARKLALKYKKPMVAGSDAHCIEMLGYAKTKIFAEPDVDSILKAIKKGMTEIDATYVPVKVLKEWSLKRINYSYIAIMNYIYDNYSQPKKILYEKLLKLTKKSPGKVDYLFSTLAYAGILGATFYSIFKTPFRE